MNEEIEIGLGDALWADLFDYVPVLCFSSPRVSEDLSIDHFADYG